MFTKFAIIDGFLGLDKSARLLDFALVNQSRFERAGVTTTDKPATIDLESRRSWHLTDGFGEIEAEFAGDFTAQLVMIFAGAGIERFANPQLELSLAAHRDGDYFCEHADSFSDTRRQFTDSDRIISAVYYFHREPAGFTGGELALKPLAGTAQNKLIAPKHDRLVIFPAFVPHEVLPVTVAGDDFADARFSVNCWVRRSRD